MRSVGTEEQLYLQFAHYLHYVHPQLDGLWHFDFGSGTKLSFSQARRQAALNMKNWPDFHLAIPGLMPGTNIVYHSLFIEMKREGTRLKKRDGSWASDHIAAQADQLNLLQRQGNVAVFGVGLPECVAAVLSYLGGATPDRSALELA